MPRTSITVSLWLAACTRSPDDNQRAPVGDLLVPSGTGTLRAASCPPGVAALIDSRTYPDIQAALDASVANDTIQVCPGTHPGGLIISHPGPLSVIGDSKVPASVVIAGGRTDHGILAPFPLEMVDVRIAGISFEDTAVVAIGIYYSEYLYIDSCIVMNPSGLGIESTASEADIRRVHVQGARGAGSEAALLHFALDRLSVIDSVFIDNSSSAIDIRLIYPDVPTGHQGQRIDIVGTDFIGNSSNGTGTAVHIDGRYLKPEPYHLRPSGPTILFTDVNFTDNHAGLATGVDVGEATVYIDSPGPSDNVVFDRVTFSGNQANSICSIYANPRADADAYRFPAPRLTIRDSTLLPCTPTPWMDAVHVYAPGHWETDIINVDVGTGPTANPGGDFGQCRSETDGTISGEIRPLQRDYCP